MWDIYAKNYDRATLSFSAYQELMKEVLDKLELRNGDMILDMGCGTGNLEKLAQKNSDANYQFKGLDISLNMLNIAKKKLKNDKRFSLKQFDLNNELDFPNATFNKVVMIHSLYTLKDLSSVLQNLRKVMKPGAQLHIVNPLKGASISQMMNYEMQKSGLILFTLKLLVTIPANIINRIISSKASKSEFHFLTNEEYVILLEKNGFNLKESSLVYANQSTYLISELVQ